MACNLVDTTASIDMHVKSFAVRHQHRVFLERVILGRAFFFHIFHIYFTCLIGYMLPDYAD